MHDDDAWCMMTIHILSIVGIVCMSVCIAASELSQHHSPIYCLVAIEVNTMQQLYPIHVCRAPERKQVFNIGASIAINIHQWRVVWPLLHDCAWNAWLAARLARSWHAYNTDDWLYMCIVIMHHVSSSCIIIIRHTCHQHVKAKGSWRCAATSKQQKAQHKQCCTRKCCLPMAYYGHRLYACVHVYICALKRECQGASRHTARSLTKICLTDYHRPGSDLWVSMRFIWVIITVIILWFRL